MCCQLQQRIEEYQQGPFADKWQGCKAFKDHQSMLQSAAKPDGVIIGVPPAVHGTYMPTGYTCTTCTSIFLS